MILDFDPFRMVERRGFAMDMRLNMPNYKIRTHHFYAGLVDKVRDLCPTCPGKIVTCWWFNLNL